MFPKYIRNIQENGNYSHFEYIRQLEKSNSNQKKNINEKDEWN